MMSKEQHVDGLVQTKNNKNSINNKNISESFKKLTHSEKSNRINGAVDLVKHLNTIKNDENQVCHAECEIAINSISFYWINNISAFRWIKNGM